MELGLELPLVCPGDIGLLVDYDAGDRLAGGGLPDPGLPAVWGEAVGDPENQTKRTIHKRFVQYYGGSALSRGF